MRPKVPTLIPELPLRIRRADPDADRELQCKMCPAGLLHTPLLQTCLIAGWQMTGQN
jgi:hypothetical protein